MEGTTRIYQNLIMLFLQLQKMTVPILKEYIKSVGIKKAGKKQDLIDAIKGHLGL